MSEEKEPAKVTLTPGVTEIFDDKEEKVLEIELTQTHFYLRGTNGMDIIAIARYWVTYLKNLTGKA